jgi:hypothetical protein
MRPHSLDGNRRRLARGEAEGVFRGRGGTEPLRLSRGALELELSPEPFGLRLLRAGVPLIEAAAPWAAAGTPHDRFIQLTEGLIPEEEAEPREGVDACSAVSTDGCIEVAGDLEGGRAFELELCLPADERLQIAFRPRGEPLRLGFGWLAAAGTHLTGLGARHGLAFDQAGRTVELGADRRYTGPDCPPDMLDQGGVPQGDYAPAPWLQSSAGWAAWLHTAGPGARFELGPRVEISQRAAAGHLRIELFTDPTPAARLRGYCAASGMPALLPAWGYGHWKSRDVYAHQDDVVEDWRGYREHRLPLDAIVIDSPWETQYNTWEFNPRQFPDAPGLVREMRADGVRTVVWVTPWVNLESSEGQCPPDAESERLHRERAPNYDEGAENGHYVSDPGGRPFVARWWMGTGSPVDFTSPAAERWWRQQARRVLELGVEGIKADDGEGYYFPAEAGFADGRSGAEAAWEYGGLYRRSMQAALDEVHPGEGVLFGRSGWSGQQAVGMLWGGDQVSDFWSLRTLLASLLTAAASGFSNLSHDVGGYLGRRLVERCPAELLLRWVQLGCFTPLMQAHGRFEQEAWRYDDRTLAIYRDYVLLHERLFPYIRAAAATAARCGLPVMRPLCLCDSGDERGWELADSYMFGPALWVSPVLEEGAEERELYLPRGDWIDFWSGIRVGGGRELIVPAPRERLPVWVRSGSILVTYPAESVARGLGDAPEDERPLEATLWGEPRGGRAGVRLADGTRVRWHHGEWSVEPEREVAYAER